MGTGTTRFALTHNCSSYSFAVPNYIPWLPHSYHAPATWFAFWQYLGMACAFWALRDWLLRRTTRETPGRADPAEPGPIVDDPGSRFAGRILPTRLRRLLWVLCLNGTLLALEGMLQRLDGTNKLLWLVEPRFTKSPETQFGPFAYRSNAAQYLNLIWPVCLGFWWVLRQEAISRWGAGAKIGSSPHILLLPCAVLAAAGPVVSTSRGGALITFALIPLTGLLLLFSDRRHQTRGGWFLFPALGVAVAVGGTLGWPALKKRLFAPRRDYPLALASALDQFSVRCVLNIPTPIPTNGLWLWCLTDSHAAWHGSPGAVSLLLAGDGSLNVFHYGGRAGEFERRRAPKVANPYRGQLVDVVITRERDLSLYLNGVKVTTRDLSSPNRTGPLPVASRYLHIVPHQVECRMPIALITVYSNALDEAGIHILANRVAVGKVEAQPTQDLPKPLLALSRQDLAAPAHLWTQTSDRGEDIARITSRMLKDFCRLGSGPGTFGPLYGMYRDKPTDEWAWYAHNDWQELAVTFGGIGSVAFALLLLSILLGSWGPGGLPLPGVLMGAIWLALAGCLGHARYDFPFQIYSVTHLFLVLAAVLVIGSLARPQGRRRINPR